MGEKASIHSYEGMFVMDTAAGAQEKLREEILQVLAKSGAEVLKEQKWVERKLAYPIRRKRRGTYFLVFFKAPSGAVTGIEKDCRLKEAILRVLILECPDVEKARIPGPPDEEESYRHERERFSAGEGRF